MRLVIHEAHVQHRQEHYDLCGSVLVDNCSVNEETRIDIANFILVCIKFLEVNDRIALFLLFKGIF